MKRRFRKSNGRALKWHESVHARKHLIASAINRVGIAILAAQHSAKISAIASGLAVTPLQRVMRSAALALAVSAAMSSLAKAADAASISPRPPCSE